MKKLRFLASLRNDNALRAIKGAENAAAGKDFFLCSKQVFRRRIFRSLPLCKHTPSFRMSVANEESRTFCISATYKSTFR